MSRSAFFRRLGAPLRHPYAWGAISQFGDVYLSVWKRDVEKRGEKEVVRVLVYNAPDRHGHPYQEREDHIQMIRSGADCYCIMCVADPSSKKLRILYCDEEKLRIGGKIIEEKRGIYLELKGTRTVWP